MKPIPKLQLGKKGLTPEFIEQVRSVFKNEKVLKIDILKSACRDKAHAKEIGEEIVKELGPKYSFKLIGYVLTILKTRKTR